MKTLYMIRLEIGLEIRYGVMRVCTIEDKLTLLLLHRITVLKKSHSCQGPGSIHVQNPRRFCPKSGLNLTKTWAFYFSYSRHRCNCWLKIVNHWDKCDNGVMCTEKEIKPGLKLVRMEINVAAHTCKLLSRKSPEHWDINIVFCKFLRNKGLSQNVGLFHLKIGLA